MSSDTKSIVKFISFKLSRIRFVTAPDVQTRQLVVTGSWMEEVNRLCLWAFDCGELLDSGQMEPVSEKEDDIAPGVLGDSIDDPRLTHSLVHYGWVQDLKVHHRSGRIFSASTQSTLQVLGVDSSTMRLTRLTSNWRPFSMLMLPCNRPVPLASLSLSPDASQLYVGDDLGRLGAVQVDRIPSTSNTLSEPNCGDTFGPTPTDQTALVQSGTDVTTLNALECVDTSSLASVNQLGQLKVWDIRCGFEKPQQRLLRPSDTQPLYCLARHPGQPHLLAVGGLVGGSGSAAYIWDLRADQYPLTEVPCEGKSVWEIGFNPRQPRNLYAATETSGLLQIGCRDDAGSWTAFKGSHKKLVVSSALPGGTSIRNVLSFDASNTKLICGHSDAIIQTVDCNVSVY